MYRKILSYFKKHPCFNSTVHVLLGVGIGMLVTYPFVGIHPLRWGLGFLVVGLLGHAYPLMAEK